MSFRIEQKYRINKHKLLYLYKWVNENEGKKIYPDRIVSSIYFDNYKLSSYHQSKEGVTPRKKIRLRFYNNAKDKLDGSNLELKINSIEGRFKKSEINNDPDKILRHGIFDREYGLCFPIIEVKYKREYFKVFNIRITIDTEIKYRKYKKRKLAYNNFYYEDGIIMEAKTSNTSAFNYIDENFAFEKIRFSKYCNAVEKIFSGQ